MSILPALAAVGKKRTLWYNVTLHPAATRCTLRLRYATRKGLDPTMKVLLIKDVYKLGRAGDVKKVADGYGRNFLLTQKLAVLATPGTLKTAEKIRAQAEIKRAAQNSELQGLSEQVNGLALTFAVKAGETGKLYGSITTQDVAAIIQEQTRYEVKRQQIDMQPIRNLGEYKARVRLTVDLVPEIKILVYREGESLEAATQAAAEAAAQAAAEPEEKPRKPRVRKKPAAGEAAEAASEAPAEAAAQAEAKPEEKPRKPRVRKKPAAGEAAEAASEAPAEAATSRDED